MAKKQTKASLGRVGRVEREQRLNRIITISTIGVLVVIVIVVLVGVIQETFITPNVTIATVMDEEINVEDFQARVRMQRALLISEFQNYSNYLDPTDPSAQQQYLSILSQYESQLDPAYLGQVILNQMIDDILVKQEAQSRGIEVTEEETAEMLNTVFGYFPDGYPTFTPAPTAEASEGEEAVEVPAIPQPTSITEEEYNQALDEYFDSFGEFGVTEEVLISIFEASLYRDKLSEELAEGISNEADQVSARHILVEELETVESIFERLENGEAWEDLALELSIDTSNSANGGDLGWFTEGTMVQEFNDAAFSGEVGTIVGPVETQFGFHLIDIVGHESRPVSAEDFQYRVNLALTDLISQIKGPAETAGRIVLSDDWVKYSPDDPSLPISAAPQGQQFPPQQ
jgi:parvulin-like peptidyl-prolyl isomerase